MIPHSLVYLDHNATTRPDADITNMLVSNLQNDHLFWGNPSSIHFLGREPKKVLRETKQLFSATFNCSPSEVIFNSGASEGNNTVLKSVWFSLGATKNEFLISRVEHPSVIKTAEYLQTLGAIIKWIPVSQDGFLDLDFIKNEISDRTALISVMFANNETGNIFAIDQVSVLAQSKNILLHVDCVQALGKENLDLKKLNVNYATFSAHKFYALKGCGILFVKKGSPYVNLIHGGGQERGRRGGTENVLAIWSLLEMMKKIDQVELKKNQMQNLRNLFETEITKKINDITITGHQAPRLANTSSLVIAGVDGETLLMSLDLKGFAVSTGAACSSGNPEPSPVLLAMGLSRQQAQSSLRVSLGWSTTETQIYDFVNVLAEVVLRLRSLNLASHEGKTEYA